MKKIIAFSGSNSSQSINQQLIVLVARMVNNAEVEVIDIRDYPAPIYGIDEEKENGFPIGIQHLSEKLQTADGIIISSPEHNGSLTAVLKNTLDWLSRLNRQFLEGKKMLLLSTSPGPRGAASSLNILVNMLPHMGAEIIENLSLGSFHNNINHRDLIPETAIVLQQKVNKFLAAL